MDRRKALTEGSLLEFPSGLYTIQKEIARGGSCIVYDAFYQATSGIRRTIRIKECYPVGLSLSRTDSGELIANEACRTIFTAAKESMRQAFRIESGLSFAGGLANNISFSWNIYEANNTVYILSAYAEGKILSQYMPGSMKECISIAKNTAIVMGKIHSAGYLYLDCKPDNIFVLSGTPGLIQFFDFNTLLSWPIRDSQQKLAGFTKGFAALEQQLGQTDRLGPWTDAYGAAALLFWLLFGRAPDALDCRENAQFRYERSRFGAADHRNKLFYELDAFFRKNLANSCCLRCQTMDEAVAQLDSLEALADTWRGERGANPSIGKKLRLYTLLCSPGDEDEPFLDLTEDLFADSENLPQDDVMALYDRAVFLHTSRGDFPEACKKLEQARRFVSRCHNPRLRARWHYMCAIFYDARLAGQYETDNENHDLRAQLCSLDKAIRCLSFSRSQENKLLLAEYTLSKCALLVRSHPENQSNIQHELLQVRKFLPCCRKLKPSLVRDFYLLCGWYFTLSRPDLAHAQKAIDEAEKIHKGLKLSELETIDELLIPCGNMLLELRDFDGADKYIRSAIALCDIHSAEASYYRKKQELLSCLSDIQAARNVFTNPE